MKQFPPINEINQDIVGVLTPLAHFFSELQKKFITLRQQMSLALHLNKHTYVKIYNKTVLNKSNHFSQCTWVSGDEQV